MKINKIVAVCGIVLAAGIVLAGIGAFFGGRVYGISFGTGGLKVNSNGKNAAEQVEYISFDEDLSSFDAMDVSMKFADFEIVESDHYAIKGHVRKDCPVTYEVNNNTLSAIQKSKQTTIVSLGVNGYSSFHDKLYVKVYVPKGTVFKDVKLDNDSGDITLGNLQADSMTVTNSFGDIKGETIQAAVSDFDLDSGSITIEKLSGEKCQVVTSFGDIDLKNTVLTKGLIGDTDSGNISLDELSADTVDLKLSFGSLSSKKMTVGSLGATLSSGDTEIDSFEGNSIDIGSSFGGVSIGVKDSVDSYSYDLDTEFGEVSVDKEDMGDKYSTTLADKTRFIRVDGDSSDITVYQAR